MMEHFAHPFAVFGPGPYTLVCVVEKLHPIGGWEPDGTPILSQGFRAGGHCDLCGHSLRWCYDFATANGTRFSVGCDCALFAYAHDAEGLAAIKAAMADARRAFYAERRERETKAAREAREALERTENGGLTLREIAEREAEEAARAAEARDRTELARRESAPFVGEVGQKIVARAVLVKSWASDFPGPYGTLWIETYRTETGASLVYRGTSPMGVRLGETIELSATVKAHGEYTHKDRIGGTERQTTIARPKLLGILDVPRPGVSVFGFLPDRWALAKSDADRISRVVAPPPKGATFIAAPA